MQQLAESRFSFVSPLLTCFCKPDLDTVLAAYLLAGKNIGRLLGLSGEASENLLCNRNILCIECGGSGRMSEANFDHHGEERLPCATEQAWKFIGKPDSMHDFVLYTSCVDTGTPLPYTVREGDIPLSSIFSGMLMKTGGNSCRKFRAGLELIASFLRLGLHPADCRALERENSLFASYVQIKRELRGALERELGNVMTFVEGNLKIMALESRLPGVHGLLRRNGADISIAGNITTRCWTISTKLGLEDILHRTLQILLTLEDGWGGQTNGGIIGSPRNGSRIKLTQILDTVRHAISHDR